MSALQELIDQLTVHNCTGNCTVWPGQGRCCILTSVATPTTYHFKIAQNDHTCACHSTLEGVLDRAAVAHLVRAGRCNHGVEQYYVHLRHGY
jgi:hypothetical protein